MPKRRQPPDPLQGRATTSKRINLENPHAEKYKAANAKIHSLVNSLVQTCAGSPDELLVIALVNIHAYAPPEAGMKAVPTYPTSEDLINRNSDLKRALQIAIDQGRYEDVMRLPILQQEVHKSSDLPQPERDTAPSNDRNFDVTFRAFGAPYVAGFPAALLKTVDKYYHVKEEYNNTLSIIQSSGTGKSRGIEEAAQSRFAFLFNIRRAVEHYTYPPPDVSVRDYFIQSATNETIRARYAAFLLSLFKCATDRLSSVGRQSVPLHVWWYNYLQGGATETEPGRKRKKFYAKVVKRATEIYDTVKGVELLRLLKASCEAFVACLRQKSGLATQPRVACLLMFDEAQELTDAPSNQDSDKRSYFHHLGSVLKELNPYAVFTVFLSTNSNLRSLAPPVHLHPSLRAVPLPPRLHPPITELPFDVFAKDLNDRLRKGNKATLSATCTTDVMVRFGRTLWHSLHEHGHTSVVTLAKEKLNPARDFTHDERAKLACLGIRIGLDFDASREVGRTMEFALVGSYMRTVFAIPEHREFMRTGTPSEPILAEAAAQLLNQGRSSAFVELAPVALNKAFQQGFLARGERGEMVGRLLWTLAHDKVLRNNLDGDIRFHKPIRVLDFLRSLFDERHWAKISAAKPVGDKNGLSLSEAFQDAYVHFSHFMDGVDCDIDLGRVYRLLLRGAALNCKRNQRSIDFVTPIMFGSPDSTTISRSKTSVLQAQIKNRNAPESFFVDPTLAKSNPARPVLSLVHELGSRQNTVKCGPYKLEADPKTHARHYQIVAKGCTSKTYGVIPTCMENTYTMLLGSNLLMDDFPRGTTEECVSLLRAQEPCNGLEKGRSAWFGKDVE